MINSGMQRHVEWVVNVSLFDDDKLSLIIRLVYKGDIICYRMHSFPAWVEFDDTISAIWPGRLISLKFQNISLTFAGIDQH